MIRVDINGGSHIEAYRAGCLDPVDTPDCLDADDASYYYHADGNYHVTAVTDMNGDVMQRISYTSHGRPRFTDVDSIPRSGPTFERAGHARAGTRAGRTARPIMR